MEDLPSFRVIMIPDGELSNTALKHVSQWHPAPLVHALIFNVFHQCHDKPPLGEIQDGTGNT